MKIIFHTDLSISKEVTKDMSGYHANDDVPFLDHALRDFAQSEVQKLTSESGERASITRMWITLEAGK